MGAWVHRLSNVDPLTRTAVCAECGPVSLRRKGYTQAGAIKWRCATNSRVVNRPHREHKGDSCAQCGFVPEHPGQLDIHHRDHDHSNNDPGNLETLCANCHRLEHLLSGGGDA